MERSDMAPGAGRPAVFPIPFCSRDRLFAALFLALGYLFWEAVAWRSLLGLPWAVSLGLFSLAFAAAVLALARSQGRRPAAESWYWLAVTQALVWSFAAPRAFAGMGVSLGLALALSAVAAGGYWAFAACGGLTEGRTGMWLPADVLCCFFAAPFGNFALLPRHLLAGLGGALRRGWRGRGAALAGLAAGAGLCAAAFPLLGAADGAFAGLLGGLRLPRWGEWDAVLLRWTVKTLFAVPTGCYLYGLCRGALARRPAGAFRREGLAAAVPALRAVPLRTEALALGALCGLYGLFVAFQARYLAGALAGALPPGFTYAAWARQGFFQLLQAALLNGCVLAAAWLTARRGARLGLLRGLCGALCVLTELLLATAGAKLGLYVAAYGWTGQRFRAAVALGWLCWVFLCAGARVRRACNLPALALLPGAAAWCLVSWATF